MPRLATLALLFAALPAAADPPKKPDIPPDFDTAELFDLLGSGAKPVKEMTDPKTGFVVGGTNTTARIRTLTELNGLRIADLKALMRPGVDLRKVPGTGTSWHASKEGFLGRDEKLLEVLAADNDTVLARGLTHAGIAAEMRAIAAVAAWRLASANKDTSPVAGTEDRTVTFVYRGRRFEASMVHTRGYQDSPFQDGTRSGSGIGLKNLDTGKEVGWGLLVPHMIERYGFYEGTGTTYRVDPGQLVAVLDFLEPAKK